MAKKIIGNGNETFEYDQGKEEQKKEVKRHWTSEFWRGVKEVFRCAECGEFRDTKDEMIEHILLHYSEDKREEALEILMKEK